MQMRYSSSDSHPASPNPSNIKEIYISKMIISTADTSGMAKSTRRLAIMTGLLLASFIAGCASTKPTPAEVCSAAWIKPRTDAAINDFTRSTKGSWEQLQRSGERAANEGSLGFIERASVILSLTRLLGQFQDSQALADLRTLSTTCNDPDLVRNALVDTLEEYDVPEPFIDLMGQLEEFIELMDPSGSNQ